jgi:Tfp pilus assembly protein PilX
MLLIKPGVCSMQHPLRKVQSGVVLIIALIVLVAMTLAALALIRSVDTNNLIAGNMAFQQAAAHSADAGIETAAAWLGSASDTDLESDHASSGYVSDGSLSSNSPAADTHYSWDEYWSKSISGSGRVVKLPQDQAGNTAYYVIDRLCTTIGAKNKINCVVSPSSRIGEGNSAGTGSSQFNAPITVYYRITVRVEGPRNTVSYVQSVVSK